MCDTWAYLVVFHISHFIVLLQPTNLAGRLVLLPNFFLPARALSVRVYEHLWPFDDFENMYFDTRILRKTMLTSIDNRHDPRGKIS